MMFSFLIVNFNGIKHLKECLLSVFSQSFHDFEVVLVDNASTDGSLEYVRKEFPNVTVIASEVNTGFSGGNNLGLPHCRGDFVFLLNNDTRLEKDALENLARATEAYPKTGIFACFLLDYYRPDRVDSAGDTFYTNGRPFSFSGFPAALFSEARSVTSACAGAAVYRRDLINRLGGFDEDYFLIFEDTDLSLRARHAGEDIVFLPNVRVHHKGSASLGGKLSPLTVYYSERNHFNFFVKNYPLRSLALTIPGYSVLKVLRLFHAAKAGCLWAYVRGNARSLLMLPKAISKRKKNLATSKLSPKEFHSLLRPHWLKDRIKISHGDFSLTIN